MKSMKPEAKSASGFLIEPDYRTPNRRRVVKINDASFGSVASSGAVMVGASPALVRTYI